MEDVCVDTSAPEAFRKLLIPEIFSEILRNLTAHDRLSMRAVSRECEAAVAASDMYIDGYPGMSIIYISSGRRAFKVHLGLKSSRQTLRLRGSHVSEEVTVGGEGLEEVARVRARLFKTVYTKYVDITNINFNNVPVSHVEQVLEGCMFEELEIKIELEGYNSDVFFDFLLRLDSNKCKKTKLTLINILPSDNPSEPSAAGNMLILLNPMLELNVRRCDNSISEEIFIEMVKRGHSYVKLPIIVTSEQIVSDVKKIVEDSAVPQGVAFKVAKNAIEQFMIIMGYKMVKGYQRRRRTIIRGKFHNIIKNTEATSSEQVHLEKRYFTKSNQWNGGFDLFCEKVKISVKLGDSIYSVEISNNICATETDDSDDYESD